MPLLVTKNDSPLRGTIHLPFSKSESNRALILRALSKKKIQIDNLSEADDTRIVSKALNKISLAGNSHFTEINVENAGTAMRFLTAFCAVQPEKKIILTGSERMKQRPVGPLVMALQQWGAAIEYAATPGFPPLAITGKKLAGGKISIGGNISSQFISALVMIAPVPENGVILEIKGELTSEPYLDMTLKIMEYFGIKYERAGRAITIKNQPYQPVRFKVEPDWSAASYWYEMVAFSESAEIRLAGLKKDSLQGDSIAAKLFEPLGVKTTFDKEAVLLEKINVPQPSTFDFDFSPCPDLAQTLAVTCAGLRIPARLSGLRTLRIKETDRIQALQNELRKTGASVEISGDELHIRQSSALLPEVVISTYGDHRMAMAFAPLALKTGAIKIESPEVVDKSYPGFWRDLKRAGIRSERIKR